MEVINTTSRKRETYRIQVKYSILWECALGIAAITNSSLLSTLEKPREYWEGIKASLSNELLEHLNYVEENNTWKALLLLLHQQDFTNIIEFTNYIEGLKPTELKLICLPYIGIQYNDSREHAASGNKTAILEMKELTKDNPFFPNYIEFICTTDIEHLKGHLIFIMKSWFDAVVEPESKNLTRVLRTDYDSKKLMLEKMNPEELVQWATGGITYMPEPSVHHVLLIPQFIYRPWNIEADLEGTKVFYYPIANESISPGDKYLPNNFLVLKHKAIGDEARLRIVKLLSESDRTLQDITDHLNIGKSTIHHHLKILRSAKLVEIIESKYRLKKNAVDSLSKELELFLKQ